MIRESRPIVVVEDSDEDYEVLQRLLSRLNVTNPIYRCRDAEECMRLLETVQTSPQSPAPALILLDLNLPGTSGNDVLGQIKVHPTLKKIPVTVVTSSADARDVDSCYQLGANGYLVKQGDLIIYQKTLRHLINYWFDAVVLP